MRSILGILFSATLLLGVAVSQQTPPDTQTPRSDERPNQPSQPSQSSTPSQPTQPQAANHMKIAPGSVIPVQLSKTIDVKKAKTGDEVVATVTQDMKTNSGDVLVPKDTKVIGHVTEAQARSKEQKQSELGIAFDHALVKGEQMQLPMSIQAVIAPPSNNPNANSSGSPASAPSAPAPSGGSANAPMGGSQGGSQGSHQGGTSGAGPLAQGNAPAGASEPEQQGSAPPITGNTQGVIGMENVKLESGSQNSQQGSVLTSEKNNVKIEKGTMLLLRVSQ